MQHRRVYPSAHRRRRRSWTRENTCLSSECRAKGDISMRYAIKRSFCQRCVIKPDINKIHFVEICSAQIAMLKAPPLKVQALKLVFRRSIETNFTSINFASANFAPLRSEAINFVLIRTDWSKLVWVRLIADKEQSLRLVLLNRSSAHRCPKTGYR